MTCRESVSLGAYLLGMLDPAARAAFEAHLADCPDCPAEIVAMAPIPGILRHTPFADLPQGSPVWPAPPPLPEEAEPVPPPSAARRRRQRRPGVRRALIAASAAGVVAAAGVGLWGAFAPEHSAPRPAITLSAQDPSTHVSASAVLTPDAAGTRMDLTLTGLPDAVTCHLVVHGMDGKTETAAGWASGWTGGVVKLPASTSMSPSDIARLDIVTDTGKTLVEMDQSKAGGGPTAGP